MLGLNTATIPRATLEEAVHVAVVAGFQGIEPRVPLLMDWGSKPVEVLCFTWLPLNSLEELFALSLEELKGIAKKTFVLARQFGIPGVISVPGVVLSPNLDEAVYILSWLKRLAAMHNVELLYEMLGFPNRAFPHIQDTLKLVSKAEIRLVLDTFHLAISGAKPNEISKIPGSMIGLVHLSDAITEGKAVEELTDEDRVLPGEGSLRLPDILAAIRKSGFKGMVSVEVFHPKYSAMDPYIVAREAFVRARDILKEAGW